MVDIICNTHCEVFVAVVAMVVDVLMCCVCKCTHDFGASLLQNTSKSEVRRTISITWRLLSGTLYQCFEGTTLANREEGLMLESIKRFDPNPEVFIMQ